MKKLLFIFFIFPLLGKAQFIVAGQLGGHYVDIVPDTTIRVSQLNIGSWSATYKLDIDNDIIPDVNISVSRNQALGGGNNECKISSINPKVKFFQHRIDSTHLYNPVSQAWWYHTTIVAKCYNSNDTIKPGPLALNLGYIYSTGYLAGPSWATIDWLGTGDKYIGLTYDNGINVDYGWIRFRNDSLNQITIKDFSVKFNCAAFPAQLNVSSGNSLICVGESVTLSANGATTYTWSSGSNNPSIIVSPTTTTGYTITGTSTIGCQLTNTITVLVDPCIGIKEYENHSLKIFPNPAKEAISIKGNIDLRNAELEIVNVVGQVVMKQEFNESTDVASLQPGIYFLKLNIDNYNSYYRFVKE